MADEDRFGIYQEPLDLPEFKSVSKPQEFQTKDLYLAAAILALKVGTLETVDKHDKRHMKFLFSGLGLEAVQDRWTNRLVEVNAADYADAIRKMKSIIHSED